MRQNQFEIAMSKGLRLIALLMILVSGVCAQPKFKVLATVPGGLWSGVSFDAKGNLYGTTTGGGTQNKGTIFELSPGAHGWALNIIHSFDGYDGGGGNGGLIFDAAGNMYGTTPAGGSTDGGVVFEMTTGSDGWTYDILYTFCQEYHCRDGSAPQSGVILDGSGNLYGATAGGGEYDGGAVVELTGGSVHWQENVLYSFCSEAYCHDGQAPFAGVVADKAGNLYGTTSVGGAYGYGSVFNLRRLAGGAWKLNLPHSFAGSDGATLYDALVYRGDGSLYGTTTGGGTSGFGVVFRLTPEPRGRWKETALYEFPTQEGGRFPNSSLVFDRAGNLYGTTAGGGDSSCSCGVVYELSAAADGKWKYSVLHRFTGGDGFHPDGVVLDEKGNLYGTAYSVVFEITP